MTATGPNNPNWKGGRVVDPRGYVLIRVGKGHPLADVRGYAYEHRLRAQERAGRSLRAGEEVHHDDRSPTNNGDGNLILCGSHAEHGVHHRKPGSKVDRLPGDANDEIECACGCGAKFPRFDRWRRSRRFVSGHNLGAV